MARGDPMKGAVVAVILFFLSLFSYSPLAIEINEYAINATLTTPIWEVLDTLFPYLWSIWCIVWLAVAVQQLLKVK